MKNSMWGMVILTVLLSGCSATFKVGGGGGYCEDSAGIYLPYHAQ